MTARALVRATPAGWRVVSVCVDQDVAVLLEDHLRWRGDRRDVRLVRCSVNQLCGQAVQLDASGLEVAPAAAARGQLLETALEVVDGFGLLTPDLIPPGALAPIRALLPHPAPTKDPAT